jgi:TonB family protein
MFGVEEEEETQAGRLLPGLRSPAPAPKSKASPATQPVPIPQIDEIIERIEYPQRRFPFERAILISLILHLLLLVLLLLHPMRARSLLLKGKETVQERAEREAREAEFRVPVKFFVESPGPARRNANPNAPPSDKTRRAGGGDKTKPRSETPFIAQQSGIEGLRPGERSKEGSRTADSAAPDQASKSSPGLVVTPGAAQRLPNLSKAIQSAAGNPFAGEGGAPHAKESGGFVDSGPLSFDTKWYDWGDYAEEMIRRIKLHWEVPELARMGVKGKLTVRFYIRADGTVEGEKILRESTIPPYDHAAFQAIATSSPFRPLPKDLHEAREGVTIIFFYNIRPGDEGKVP